MTSPPPSALSRLDDALARVERALTVGATAVMGAVVFLDVLHRVASRQRGLLMRIVGEDKAWANPLGTALGLVVAVLVVYAALRTRGLAPGASTAGRALLVTGLVYGALRLFLWILPNGLVWSQTFGLILMLLVGLVGASIAAKEHRHLALDLGSKLWPARLLPLMQAVGNVVTALFCWVFAALAVVSLRAHFGDWNEDHSAGLFVALPIPKWLAFIPIPITFVIMGARFVVQAAQGLRGVVEEDDALHMLGLDAPAGEGEAQP